MLPSLHALSRLDIRRFSQQYFKFFNCLYLTSTVGKINVRKRTISWNIYGTAYTKRPPFTPVVCIQSSQPSLPRAATVGEEKGGAVGGDGRMIYIIKYWQHCSDCSHKTRLLLGGEPQYLYTSLYFRSLRCRAGREDNNTPSGGTNVTNIINIFIALWQIFWKHLMWCNGDNLVVFYIWIVDMRHHHITNIFNEFEKYLPLTLRYAS